MEGPDSKRLDDAVRDIRATLEKYVAASKAQDELFNDMRSRLRDVEGLALFVPHVGSALSVLRTVAYLAAAASSYTLAGFTGEAFVLTHQSRLLLEIGGHGLFALFALHVLRDLWGIVVPRHPKNPRCTKPDNKT